MTAPSSRALEQLSAYLDGQLSQSSRTRLETRIHSDLAMANALEELRQTRAFLRRTPHRRAPRNFTLTPGMAGIHPPVPPLVPALSWASAVAMLFFIFTLAAGLVGQLSLGMATAVSLNAAAPRVSGAGPLAAATAAPAIMAPEVAASATAAPLGGGSSNQPPVDQTGLPTPTEETSIMAVVQATPPGEARVDQSPLGPKAPPGSANPWLFFWPGLAVLLGALAILALWLNKRSFQRKNPRG